MIVGTHISTDLNNESVCVTGHVLVNICRGASNDEKVTYGSEIDDTALAWVSRNSNSFLNMC